MHRKELNERSPLRIFEQSIHGGLGRGNIGVVTARRGVGKTAFLVGVALDDLMRGKKVFHVALGQSINKVRDYYTEIFEDLARTAQLEDAWQVYREIERNRNIHAYFGNTFSVTKLQEDLDLLKEHINFEPSAILVDGYDFDHASREDLQAFRELARREGAELWMSAITHRESRRDERGIPEPVAHVKDAVDVIVLLAHDRKSAVHVTLLKDHDNPEVSSAKVALNPTTMLLVQE